MAPKASQTSQTKKKPAKSLLKIPQASQKSDASTAPLKRIDPLTAFSNVPNSQAPTPPASQNTKAKGKQKSQNVSVYAGRELSDTKLWVDIYEPRNEAELAVHPRKAQDVRNWLDEAFEGGPSGKLRKYRRILALTGAAGTGKTATIRVLAREMDFEIMEWRNGIGETTSSNTFWEESGSNAFASSSSYDYTNEAHFAKFEAFLTRASSCNNVFGSSTPQGRTKSEAKRRVILLEDLPNITHTSTRNRFHAALQSIIENAQPNPVPIIVVISDAGLRGEASDERLATGIWSKDKDGVVDVRTVIPKELLHGPYVTQIRFNPIAPTILTKALQALLKAQFASIPRCTPPSKDFLDVIVESSNGDIRSAVMALQFACIVEIKGTKKKGKGLNTKVVLESVTRREQSLALFHLIGKVMYNKRKGDPPAPSTSARDAQKEREFDARLQDPPPLPSFLSEHDRKASRVDVDQIYADSPIDSGLFSLYIHQNYSQFCDELEHVDGVADWLSWVDCSGGEHWYQTNPHQFHLLTLGTLHSLPAPVQRRNQKVFKPEYFDFLNKERDAFDSVRDLRGWVQNKGWLHVSNSVVATELGALLKSMSMYCFEDEDIPPPRHQLFSNLPYNSSGGGQQQQQLGEHEDDDGGNSSLLGFTAGDWAGYHQKESATTEASIGGWLDEDDIEEF